MEKDIIERLYDISERPDCEYSSVLYDAVTEIERLESVMEPWRNLAKLLEGDVATLRATNERLRSALEKITKYPRGGLIDTPEKLERDEMIGIARAALAQEKSND
jgi:hypothetical protein